MIRSFTSKDVHQSLRAVVMSALCLFGSGHVLGDSPIQWRGNGFATLGMGIADSTSIDEANAWPRIAYEESIKYDVDSKIGYQATAEFSSELELTVQAIARSMEDYDIEVDWAYLKYSPTDSLSFKLGRQLRPIYKYSDYVDIGYAYPWIRPPVEVYSYHFSFFYKVDAISVRYSHELGDWSIDWDAYYGNSSPNAALDKGRDVKTKTRDDIGLFFTARKDNLNFRLGYNLLPKFSLESIEAAVQLFNIVDSTRPIVESIPGLTLPDLETDAELTEIRSEFYSIGIGYEYNDWLLDAEWAHLNKERSFAADEQSWYVMLGRRINEFTLHYTYAKTKRTNDDEFAQPFFDIAAQIAPFSAGLATQVLTLAEEIDQASKITDADLDSHTLGVRYDFNAPVALKFEVTVVNDDRYNLKNHFTSLALDFLF